LIGRLAAREEGTAQAALDELICAGAPAVPLLCAALRDAEPGQGVWICLALGAIGDRHAAPYLATAIASVSFEGRISASNFSGSSAWASQSRNPARTSKDEEQIALRREAALALAALGDPESARLLVWLLAAPDFAVSAAAYEALVTLGAAAIEPLVTMLPHHPVPARRAAIGIMATIGTAACIAPLCAALGDPDLFVRRAAAEALLRVAEQQPRPELRAAVAPLRRLLSPLMMQSSEDRRLFRATLARIEAVTGQCRDLPLPASAALPATASLPCPSLQPVNEEQSEHEAPAMSAGNWTGRLRARLARWSARG
jgi:HEAT repeat protein